MTEKQGNLMLFKMLIKYVFIYVFIVLYVFIYVSLYRDTVCLYMRCKKLALVLHGERECPSAAGVPPAHGLVP